MSNTIINQIRAKILMSGPISIAEYMQLALFQNVQTPNDGTDTSKRTTDRKGRGYYMGKDVFGREGDFITSPEINQMFGEMVGVWGLQTWTQIGGPKKFSIVEMGPGRGTMAKDVLRVFRRFLPHPVDISLHLVEISPHLANLQAQTLCKSGFASLDATHTINPSKCVADKSYYYHDVTSDTNTPVFWYQNIRNVPHDFNFYIAHEFFDVLPIHKLQKVQDTWREVLIDLHPYSPSRGIQEKTEFLRYVLSRNETPVIKMLQNLYPSLLNSSRNHLEISVSALEIYEELCSRLESQGGIVLLVDYGHQGTKEDTFRGFHQHKVVSPLILPGQIDLTADVDLSCLCKVCENKVLLLGPISQRDFLRRIGISTRARTLFQACKTLEDKRQLLSGYKMLLTELGDKFLCIAMLPKVMEDFRPKLKILAFD